MLRKLISSLLHLFSKALPYFLIRFIYRFPIKLIERKLSVFHGSLWVRNSVYFDDIEFGVSDIDLTYYFHQKGSVEQYRRVDMIHQKYKKYFWHIGEIVSIDKAMIEDFGHFINSYEILRDPSLLKVYDELDIKIEREKVFERISFSLDWLEKDAHKMRANIDVRQKKIRRFVQLLSLEIKSDYYELSDVINQVVNDVFLIENEKKGFVHAFLEDFCCFDFNSASSANDFYEHNRAYRRLYCVFYPARWLGASIHFENFSEECSSFSTFTAWEKKVFCSRLYWELWGLVGQIPHINDRSNMLIHLENLEKVVKAFGELNALEKAITELINYNQSFWDEEGNNS